MIIAEQSMMNIFLIINSLLTLNFDLPYFENIQCPQNEEIY
jgi:hypothetical protein